MSRIAVRLCMIAAPFLATAPAAAQQPLGQPIAPEAAACPAADPSEGTPLELRVAGRLMRVQIRDTAEEEDGAHLQLRLVGCDATGAKEVAGASPSEEAAGGSGGESGSPFLRLMHDLRVGLELAPTEDGRCVRARIAVDDRAETAAADRAAGAPAEAASATAPRRPVGVELCGLPFPLMEQPDRP